jgi:hypothetical protein
MPMRTVTVFVKQDHDDVVSQNFVSTYVLLS